MSTRKLNVGDLPKGPVKCRIPQRLPLQRQRPVPYKTKTNTETLRPKSASRTKEDNFNRGTHQVPRIGQPDRERNPLKRPSTIARRLQNDTSLGTKGGRNVITVPIGSTQRLKHSAALPDQETIRKREDLELLRSGLLEDTELGKESAAKALCTFINTVPELEGESAKLKLNWQHHVVQFDQMKYELGERQKAIVELYASIQDIHRKMTTKGLEVALPPPEELQIMNVAKLTPDQLLQLCSLRQGDSQQVKGSRTSDNFNLTVDVNKLYGLPKKVVATCEQTLLKHKEIIDWFDSLKSGKGISVQSLERKINEFSAENDMLKSALDQAQGDCLKEINEIVEFMRLTVKEAVDLQLRSEEQMYNLSELTAQNNDLRKQLHNTECLKTNKGKVEELEKELKEERTKKNMMKDRLSRAEGQVKIGVERASQLEAALEQARSQVFTLERTVQQLTKQNQKLQSDFDKELGKLTESIRKNTLHLEEIAEARGKLKTEKEDLERRLEQLSQTYNESLEAVKHDMNLNLAKLIETEKKYQEEAELRKGLADKLESVSAQSEEYEKRNKELTESLKDLEEKLSKRPSINDTA